jgi:hypothetical protein
MPTEPGRPTFAIDRLQMPMLGPMLGVVIAGILATSLVGCSTKGALPLRTLATDNGACRGVGIDATLAGAANDPRVVWLVSAGGVEGDIIWPPGFSARFDPGLQVLDASGTVVFRAGDKISSGCVAPADSHGPVLVIRPGY